MPIVAPARSLLVMPLPLMFAVQEALQLRRGAVLRFGRESGSLIGLALSSGPGRPRGTGLWHSIHHFASVHVVLETEKQRQKTIWYRLITKPFFLLLYIFSKLGICYGHAEQSRLCALKSTQSLLMNNLDIRVIDGKMFTFWHYTQSIDTFIL